MLHDVGYAEELAAKLLKINAVKLNLSAPFQWSSGWFSPIYCDNRLTLSYPEIRTSIKTKIASVIKQKFEHTELIAGVATAGIAIGALVADELGLPFAYVRPEPKKHGLGNQIEGRVENGCRTVVVEDLISTGNSSLKVVRALREQGAEVQGLAAIFTYGFPHAEEAFKAASCPFFTLSDYETLLKLYVVTHAMSEAEMQHLFKWQDAPHLWQATPKTRI